MQGKIPQYSIMVLAIFMFLGSVTASNWEFEVLDEPYNVDMLSNDTNAIFVADLQTDSGDRLTPDDLHQNVTNESYSNQYIIYEYETLNGTVNESLNFHDDLGKWYAEFKTDNVDMEEVTFRAFGEAVGGYDDSGSEAVENYPVTVGDIEVDFLTDIIDPIRAERQLKIDVRTTNTTSGQIVDRPRPEIYFHNVSETEESYFLENFNDDPQTGYNFNAEVGMPEAANSTYILRTTAEEYDNYMGSYSQFVNTGPDIEGEATEIFGGDNCDTSTLSERCEVETDLDLEFGITAAQVEAVNASIYGYNETGEVLFDEKEMDEVEVIEEGDEEEDEHGQLFDTNLTIPDINTSKYENEVRIDFYAWEDDRSYSESHRIDLETYRIEDRSNPTAFKDRTHEMRLRMGKYFSLNAYDLDRFRVLNATLTRGDFEQNFTIEDFDFSDSDGIASADVIIPSDEEPGTYSLHVEAINKFNESHEYTSSLTVSDLDASFESESEKSLEYNKTGLFSEEITIENLVDADKNVETTIEGLEDVVNMPDSFSLQSGEERQIDFDVNYTEPEDLDGEIIFQDTDVDYNDSTRVYIDGPSCSLWESDLCLGIDELDLYTNESATTEEFKVRNLDEDEIDVNFTMGGNVSDVASVSDMSVEDYETAVMEVEPSSDGFYEGYIAANTTNATLDIPLSIQVDLDEDETEEEEYLELDPSRLDFGTVPEGETHSDTVTVENLASSTIEDISVDSDTFDIETDSFDLDSEETENVEIEIGEPDAGTVEFVGTVDDEEVSESLEIQGATIEDYSQRTDEIQERIDELRPEIDDADLDSDLTEVSGQIDQINSYWEQGEYETAESEFNSAQTTLDTVESQMDAEPSNGDDGATEPDEGGGLLLPLIGILFLLILIGSFVFYESYIPEEGDPLYGVLGE